MSPRIRSTAPFLPRPQFNPQQTSGGTQQQFDIASAFLRPMGITVFGTLRAYTTQFGANDRQRIPGIYAFGSGRRTFATDACDRSFLWLLSHCFTCDLVNNSYGNRLSRFRVTLDPEILGKRIWLERMVEIPHQCVTFCAAPHGISRNLTFDHQRSKQCRESDRNSERRKVGEWWDRRGRVQCLKQSPNDQPTVRPVIGWTVIMLYIFGTGPFVRLVQAFILKFCASSDQRFQLCTSDHRVATVHARFTIGRVYRKTVPGSLAVPGVLELEEESRLGRSKKRLGDKAAMTRRLGLDGAARSFEMKLAASKLRSAARYGECCR